MTSRTLILFLSFFVFACGQPRVTECGALEGLLSVGAAYEMDCHRFKENVILAREMLATKGIGISPAGVHVSAEDIFYDETGRGYLGSFHVLDGIRLNRSGESLLHELIHAWETYHFVAGTVAHNRWEEKGYFQLSDEFKQKRVALE